MRDEKVNCGKINISWKFCLQRFPAVNLLPPVLPVWWRSSAGRYPCAPSWYYILTVEAAVGWKCAGSDRFPLETGGVDLWADRSRPVRQYKRCVAGCGKSPRLWAAKKLTELAVPLRIRRRIACPFCSNWPCGPFRPSRINRRTKRHGSLCSAKNRRRYCRGVGATARFSQRRQYFRFRPACLPRGYGICWSTRMSRDNNSRKVSQWNIPWLPHNLRPKQNFIDQFRNGNFTVQKSDTILYCLFGNRKTFYFCRSKGIFQQHKVCVAHSGSSFLRWIPYLV